MGGSSPSTSTGGGRCSPTDPDAAPPVASDPEMVDFIRHLGPHVHGDVESATFAVGDRVRVRRMRPEGHHRCPRYLRGVVGEVERVCGVDPFPVYVTRRSRCTRCASRRMISSVRASEEPPYVLLIDLWERYLEQHDRMITHDHDHDDGHSHYDSPLSRRRRSEMELRAMALEAALVEKGLVATDAIDEMVEYMEHRIGPHHGARVVARAWTDPEFKQRLLDDGTAAIAELGISGPEGNVRVVENTARGAQPRRVHAVLVLPVAAARPAADLVQELRLPVASGGRTASRAARVRSRARPPTSRSACGTRAPRSATSSSRSARRTPSDLDRGRSSPALVTRDSMIGTGVAQ